MVHRDAFSDCGGGLVVRDSIWYGHDDIGFDQAFCAIAAGCQRIADAIAYFELGNALTDSGNFAGTFNA